MSFDLPRHAVAPVRRVDVRLDPNRHPFEKTHLSAIDTNWQLEQAANPALFDGTVVLLSELSLKDEILVGVSHPVRYATLLYWRKNRGAPGVEHSFAHPALVSRDNALVAIRMGKHTANPSQVYFPAGSFEPFDFVDGVVDLHGNMSREVHEETGLDISNARRDSIDHVHSANSATVIFRRYWLDEDAQTVANRIEEFVASEAHPEIEGPVIIRDGGDRPEGLLPHMKAIVRWHFANPRPV